MDKQPKWLSAVHLHFSITIFQGPAGPESSLRSLSGRRFFIMLFDGLSALRSDQRVFQQLNLLETVWTFMFLLVSERKRNFDGVCSVVMKGCCMRCIKKPWTEYERDLPFVDGLHIPKSWWHISLYGASLDSSHPLKHKQKTKSVKSTGTKNSGRIRVKQNVWILPVWV